MEIYYNRLNMKSKKKLKKIKNKKNKKNNVLRMCRCIYKKKKD